MAWATRHVLSWRGDAVRRQYSTENQADAIRQYAERRGMEIVRTYADEGRSGLRLHGRNALKQLIDRLGNARVARWLSQHRQEYLTEFQSVAEIERLVPLTTAAE